MERLKRMIGKKTKAANVILTPQHTGPLYLTLHMLCYALLCKILWMDP